jgi:DNA polymerase-3 subunit beta
MRVKVNADVLADTIACPYRTSPSRSTLPIYKALFLSAADGALQIIGTNGHTWAQSISDCDVVEEGEAAVSAKKLRDWVNLVDGEVEIVSTDSELKFSCGSFEMALPISGGDFPLPDIEGGETILRMSNDEFQRRVRHILSTIDKENPMPILESINVKVEGGRVTISGADGTRASMDETFADYGDGEANIPSAALVNWKYARTDDIELQAVGNSLLFVGDECWMFSNLLAGNYPNVSKARGDSNINITVQERETFASAVEAAMLFASDYQNVVIINVTQDGLSVRGWADTGEGVSFVPAEVEGEDVRVGLNGEYLVDALKVMKGEVYLGCNGENTPLQVRCSEFPALWHIIMPMHL